MLDQTKLSISLLPAAAATVAFLKTQPPYSHTEISVSLVFIVTRCVFTQSHCGATARTTTNLAASTVAAALKV